MARSKISDPTQDLVTDSGAVLWSIVRGEQLEFPVQLSFMANASDGYTYEAVVIEALNIVGQTTKPTTVKTPGQQKSLTIRFPTDRGTWNAPQAYNREEIVQYNSLTYRLLSGAGRVSAVTPDVDPYWELTTANTIYVQFTSDVGSNWAVQPSTEYSTYGFFELRVTEPSWGGFQRTWKPVRGMIELQFSPTDIVVDGFNGSA